MVSDLNILEPPVTVPESLLKEGMGSTMIVLGSGRTSITSLGLFMLNPPCLQVLSPFTSWEGGGGGGVFVQSPPLCYSSLCGTLWA